MLRRTISSYYMDGMEKPLKPLAIDQTILRVLPDRFKYAQIFSDTLEEYQFNYFQNETIVKLQPKSATGQIFIFEKTNRPLKKYIFLLFEHQTKRVQFYENIIHDFVFTFAHNDSAAIIWRPTMDNGEFKIYYKSELRLKFMDRRRAIEFYNFYQVLRGKEVRELIRINKERYAAGMYKPPAGAPIPSNYVQKFYTAAAKSKNANKNGNGNGNGKKPTEESEDDNSECSDY